MKKKPSRRRFIGETSLVVAGTGLTRCFPDVGGQWTEPRAVCADPPGVLSSQASRVVEVANDAALTEEPDVVIHADVVLNMVNELLAGLTDGAQYPWQTLLPDFATGMRIGLKVNALNEQCPTSVPVVQAVVATLQADLGLSGDDIIVWDRRTDELTRCGFTPDVIGTQVFGTHTTLEDTTGPGYETAYCDIVAGKTTRLSRILTEVTDITLNCPVLKTHAISGVTGAMKNLYGVIDNPSDFHSDLNATLPRIYSLEPIRNRVRLAIVDALQAVTVGGTSSPADTVPKRIFASQDPVAVDAYALQLANQLRAEKNVGLSDVDSRFTAWIAESDQLGLGRASFELTARKQG